jgi:DNA-binding Lrp family transcriptional regulator
MRDLDEQEKKILNELVRNPRISDNQISSRTGIPVKTVNRKRKIMEKDNLIYYMAFIDNGEKGTGNYLSQHMYLLKLKFGITAALLNEKFPFMMNGHVMNKHVIFSGYGEMDGNICLIIVLESYKSEDIIEIFNAEIVSTIHNFIGRDSIIDVKSIPLRRNFKLFHNYMPYFNMENGLLKKDWNNNNIFIN